MCSHNFVCPVGLNKLSVEKVVAEATKFQFLAIPLPARNYMVLFVAVFWPRYVRGVRALRWLLAAWVLVVFCAVVDADSDN